MTNYLSRTRRDHELWDKRINDRWGGQKPILSPEESLLAARKLYRHAMGKPWPRKWALTTGNRHTWPSMGTYYVNPNRRWGHVGLRDIIHAISHYCHRRLHPHDKPHSIRQLRLEARLTKFALDRRWHEGALKRPEREAAPVEPKPKPDRVVQRYARMVARRDKYRREWNRFERLLNKAEREVRTYETRHGARLHSPA